MGLFGKKDKDDLDKRSEKEDDEEEEEEEEDSDEDETYSMNIACGNCEDEYSYDIPKGTTIKAYLADKICENCGCKLVQ
jgi:hypothetical protein